MSALRGHSFSSLEEYLAIERTSPLRHEFRNGEVFCMGGAQPEHNRICLKLGSELRARLRGSPCQAFPSDQRVKVNAGSPYLYPDVSAACEPRFVVINGLRTLVNPVLVVAVMSPSTAENDRGATLLQSQTLESLRGKNHRGSCIRRREAAPGSAGILPATARSAVFLPLSNSIFFAFSRSRTPPRGEEPAGCRRSQWRLRRLASDYFHSL